MIRRNNKILEAKKAERFRKPKSDIRASREATYSI